MKRNRLILLLIIFSSLQAQERESSCTAQTDRNIEAHDKERARAREAFRNRYQKRKFFLEKNIDKEKLKQYFLKKGLSESEAHQAVLGFFDTSKRKNNPAHNTPAAVFSMTSEEAQYYSQEWEKRLTSTRKKQEQVPVFIKQRRQRKFVNKTLPSISNLMSIARLLN